MTAQTPAIPAPRRSVAAALIAATLHRIDAWGVALIVCSVALLVHRAATVKGALLVATVGLAYWLGYMVNDWFDRFNDAKDPGDGHCNLFVESCISTRWAAVGFMGVALTIAGGFVLFGIRGLGVFVFCLLAMWSYSAPPLRLKSRPVLDLLSHALLVQTLPYAICVLLIGTSFTVFDAVFLAINFLASLSGQLAQQIRDVEVDQGVESNFTLVFGVAVSRRLLQGCTFALVLTAASGFALGILPLVLAPMALAFAPAALSRLAGLGRRSGKTVVATSVSALIYAVALVATNGFSFI